MRAEATLTGGRILRVRTLLGVIIVFLTLLELRYSGTTLPMVGLSGQLGPWGC